jgi:hypothetical protein
MSDLAGLERRYRRLLLWFPAEHRRIYGDEMIGVLIASTPDDREGPTKVAVLDLIGGGLRARFRRLRTSDGNPRWRDALAVFSFVAPIVLLAQQAAAYLSVSMSFKPYFALTGTYREAIAMMLAASALMLAALVAGPALARRGRHRPAAAIALIAVAVAVAAAIKSFRAYSAEDSHTSYFLLMLIMEVVAVAISPGPARGRRLLGRSGLLILFATVVAIMISGALHLGRGDLANLANSFDDIVPIAGVAGIARALRRQTGSRLLALFAIPGYPFIGFNLVTYVYPTVFSSNYVILQVIYLPVVAITVLVAGAAWWSGRSMRPGG